MLSLLKQELKD